MYKVETEFHGKKLIIESGKVAKQTNGSVMVRCGDSVVMVTACMADSKAEGFLPLSVDYIEKAYAAGKIPGGYLKREGRLSDFETLTSRLIDRPIRPLFQKTFTNEIQVVATVLSADPEVPTDMLAMLGASAALTISDIPFEGPIAGVRLCRIDGEFVINPSFAETQDSDLEFIVAGSKDAIVMVEGGAEQVPESELLEGIFFAHQELQALIALQEELQSQCGLEKVAVDPAPEFPAEVESAVDAFLKDRLEATVTIPDKMNRYKAISEMKSECKEAVVPDADAEGAEENLGWVSKIIENRIYNFVRTLAFESRKRIDGRSFEDVRPIDIEVGLLPRVHGSALFTRGETQGIVTTTLAVGKENAQRLDTIHDEEDRRFMLHYNFPGYSVGEVKFMRGPGRREIGHGNLAERALQYVLPNEDENPYIIRIVSEITESNGSSSMASVCGGCLSLMDAGVKIKAPVAGVAMGLLKSEEDYVVLTDILGDEDHLGDMDFKVTGSEEGVTAIQMDIKIKGLSQEIFADALEQARKGRLHILGKMLEALPEVRSELNASAPRIEVFKINTNKIRDVIGSGGKTIKSIIEAHNVQVDVQDDGTVTVASSNADDLDSAVKVIKALTEEAEIGKIYHGVVKRIESFGAFVEILPGIDGLLHVSEIEEGRTKNVEDVIKKGEQVPVKVLEIDGNRIKLSRKEAMAEIAA